MRKGVGAEVTGSWYWGSWRVVEQSRSPCPRGARHILEPAGKEGSAGEGTAASGGSEGGGGPRRRGPGWGVHTLAGRTGEEGAGRPGAPGRGRRAPEGRGERGLWDGLAEGKAQTRACGTGRSLIRTTGWKRSRLWKGVERSENLGQCCSNWG